MEIRRNASVSAANVAGTTYIMVDSTLALPLTDAQAEMLLKSLQVQVQMNRMAD